MEDNEYTTNDAIHAMIDSIIMDDNVTAQNIFQNVLAQKAYDHIEYGKQYIAQNLYR